MDATAQRGPRDDRMPPDCARIEVREILLYDWWPILGEARLFDRLGAMHVQVVRD